MRSAKSPVLWNFLRAEFLFLITSLISRNHHGTILRLYLPDDVEMEFVAADRIVVFSCWIRSSAFWSRFILEKSHCCLFVVQSALLHSHLQFIRKSIRLFLWLVRFVIISGGNIFHSRFAASIEDVSVRSMAEDVPLLMLNRVGDPSFNRIRSSFWKNTFSISLPRLLWFLLPQIGWWALKSPSTINGGGSWWINL